MAKMTAAKWNETHPVGTPVTYFPVRGRFDNGRETKTRSEAWELGGGHPVVMVEGVSGGVSLEHLHVPKPHQETENERFDTAASIDLSLDLSNPQEA